MRVIYEPKGRAREYAPLAVNHFYGCSHSCKYCYAYKIAQRRKGGGKDFHTDPRPKENVLAQLTRDAERIRDKRPVLLSFATDPYQPIEEENGITRKTIEVLHANGFPVEILTKGGTKACRDFDLLGKEDAFASTLTFLDDSKSLEWEPGAALPGDRIQAMKKAKSLGLTVWASLEPVIDPRESLKIIEQTHEFVDLYKVGKLNYHCLAKSIDWERFGYEAILLLERLGKKYYIKEDLLEYLPVYKAMIREG